MAWLLNWEVHMSQHVWQQSGRGKLQFQRTDHWSTVMSPPVIPCALNHSEKSDHSYFLSEEHTSMGKVTQGDFAGSFGVAFFLEALSPTLPFHFGPGGLGWDLAAFLHP